MSTPNKDYESLENIIDKVLEELESEIQKTSQSTVEETSEKEFKSPSVHIEVKLDAKNSEELSKVIEDRSKELVDSLKKTSEEFTSSDAFKTMTQAFSHLDKTTKNFFNQFEEIMKSQGIPVVEDLTTDDKKELQVESSSEEDNNEEDLSESEEESDSEEEDNNADDENSGTEQEEEYEDSETEQEEEYIYLIHQNGEVVGYIERYRDALDILDELFYEFTRKNLSENELLRIEKKRGSISVYRKSPYLWNVYNETCILQLSISQLFRME